MRFFNVFIEEGVKKKYAYGVGLHDFPKNLETCNACGSNNVVDYIENGMFPEITFSNSNFADFIGFDFLIVASELAVSILHEAHVCGILMHPVNLLSKSEIGADLLEDLKKGGVQVGKIPENIPRYFLMEVTSKALLHASSNFIYKPCSRYGRVKPASPGFNFVLPSHKKVVDRSTWDGSDFFRVEHFPALKFCTERVVDLYNQSKLTGLRFVEVLVN